LPATLDYPPIHRVAKQARTDKSAGLDNKWGKVDDAGKAEYQ
jgi:hypothetical protein